MKPIKKINTHCNHTDASKALAAAHRLLDRLGIPSAVGIACSDKECQFQIVHRIKTLAQTVKP
jgi:hypothetical protein